MPKFKSILLLGLIVLMVLPTYFSTVSASTGTIKINTKSASTPNQQVQAGGNVNLYFGGVTWGGTQFYLVLSQDNFQQVSTGDLIYTPKFSLADLNNSVNQKIYNNGNGVWIVGNGWINGSLTQSVPVGNYFVKAFDELSATVAVTDTSIIVYSVVYSANLQASPSSGPGGVTVAFSGSGYPPSSSVTISFYDPAFGSWNYLTTANADSSGRIAFTSEIPDLRKSVGIGDYPESYTQVSYRAEIHGVVYCYADYNEYARGLKRVGSQTASGLYGNGTNLSTSVNIKAGDSLTLSGKYFHPGVIYIRWDGTTLVGTMTADQWRNAAIIGTSVANSVGSFDTSLTIPSASAGAHFLSIEDSETKVIVRIFVSMATLNISPSSGPGGVSVQFTGSGYPASSAITISYFDSTFGSWNSLSSVTADASGRIQLNSSEMPDLRQSARGYDMPETYTTISFRAERQGTIYSYADYTEYARGLKKVGSLTANGLFGDGTNLASSVSVKAGDSLTIAGKYFHPGLVYVRWDGFTVVGTLTADQWRNAQIIGTPIADASGSFETTVTIPSANAGEHFISVEDSQAKVIVKIKYTNGAPDTTPTPIQKANSTLNLSCKSTTSYIGYKVEISGNLTSNGQVVSGAPILLSYSVTGGGSWESLSLVYTDSSGGFLAVWMPSVSGNYLIKATFNGTAQINGSSKTVNLASTPYADRNVFSVSANSTVSALAFNSVNNQLSFTVSGPSGTLGFVDIGIAKNLVTNIANLQVYLDGAKLQYTTTATADSWLLHFQYSHSTHNVILDLGQNTNPTPTSTTLPTAAPTATQTPNPTQTATPTNTATTEPTPNPTTTPSPTSETSPSPQVPELSAAAMVLLAVTASLIALIAARKKQAHAQGTSTHRT